jgi:predicted transcriptional regulator
LFMSKKIKERIHQLRRSGYSNSKIGKRVGVSPSMVSFILHDSYPPYDEEKEKLFDEATNQLMAEAMKNGTLVD